MVPYYGAQLNACTMNSIESKPALQSTEKALVVVVVVLLPALQHLLLPALRHLLLPALQHLLLPALGNSRHDFLVVMMLECCLGINDDEWQGS
jgi:hypothetical protein